MTPDDLQDWIEHGIMMDAKYMFISFDYEFHPFFVFQEQSVIKQLYDFHKNDLGSLFYVLKLDEYCFEKIDLLVRASRHFKIKKEN